MNAIRARFLSMLTLLSIFSVSAIAQTNSVRLLDGSSTLISQHNSITSAYGAIPATVTQAYIIEVTTTYTASNETFPIAFINKAGASLNNSITVRPEATATNININSSVTGDPIFYLNNADFIRIDGRPGSTGTGFAFTINNTATSSNSNTIELENGASNNIVRNCTVSNSTTSSAGRNIAILAGTGGNSNNLIFNNVVNAGRYAINLNGNTSNVNTGNVIRSCKVINPIFAAIWIQSGITDLVIDSNEIYSTTTVHDADFGVILFDAQDDTAIVSRNWIHDLNSGTNTSANIGIQIRSVELTGGNHVRFENNFIDLSGSAMANSTNVIGIKFAGSNQTSAGTYFNTIRVGGALSSGGSSGNVGSACLQNISSNTTNTFDSKNNILVNNRTGGTSGLRHVCIDLANTNGTITGDYNTYNTANAMYATLGTTLFTNLALYQTSVAPNEADANDTAIVFAAANDLHLASSMSGNIGLIGTPIVGITKDIDDEARSIPMRGADEVSPCNGFPTAGQITAPDTVCLNDSFNLELSGFGGGSGLTFQWQSRPPLGTFTNIAGALSTSLTTAISTSLEYRCLVTCSNTSSTSFSDTVIVEIAASLVAGSIAHTNSNYTFDFSIAGGSGITGYAWSFGDGSTSVAPTPSNTYDEPGNYLVEVILTSQCDTDTISSLVEVDCFGMPASAMAQASDTSICLGEEVMVTMSGYSASALAFFDLQWQQSTGGAFNDINGENNDTLLISPTVQTSYRCLITCANSASSTASDTVSVNVIETSYSGLDVSNFMGNYTFTILSPSNIIGQQWDFGDGNTSNSFDPTNGYTSTGTFTVVYTLYGVCDTITDSTTITIECIEAPDAGQISVTNVSTVYSFSSNSTSPNASYMWNFGDGNTGTGLNTSHTYTLGGTYLVELIVSNACGSDTTTREVSVTVGITEYISKETFKLFPNPTGDVSTIQTHFTTPVDIKIFNLEGRLVHAQNDVSAQRIAISGNELNLGAGTYLVQLTDGTNVMVQRWVIE